MNIKLIAQYLAGECSSTEKEDVDRWLESDTDNKKLMKEFRRIWKASGEKNSRFDRYFDTEDDWDELRNRIMREFEKKDTSLPLPHLSSSHGLNFKARLSQFMRVAAVVVIASLLGFLAYQNLNQFEQEPVEPALREIAMEKGQRGSLTLSDGTKVKLNADSKIILPNVFESDKREVTLIGEGYFDVAPNPDRPFIINTNEAVIQVLGTVFAIRSYPEDKAVQVVVKEGRVSLRSQKRFAKDKAILSAGELGQLFLADNRITTKKAVDLDLFLSWTDGYLKFENTPMDEVARQLERKYDIEVKFDRIKLKELRLTAELKSRSIRYNLDAISTSLDISYEMNQQTVVFFEKK